MIDINKNWLKENIKEYKIEKLKRIESVIINCSNTYKNVFNGSPFYENWDLESAYKVITSYLNNDALILTSNYKDNIIGFLVAIDKVPDEQRKYVKYLDNIKFIEEIGVIEKYRKQGLASEMVRILLLNYLKPNDRYIGYRTNAMRYFQVGDNENFESSLIRVQKEDRLKRLNNENIVIPELSYSEKQKFINKYIELIKNRPDLDVSNSNLLFRSIFNNLDYNMIDGNYTFQKDPTGDGNDRIFPIIDLEKEGIYDKRYFKRLS